MRNAKSLAADRSGATAVEYGLMIAAFGGVILFVIFLLGNKLNGAREGLAGGDPRASVQDAGSFIHTNPDAR